MCLIMFNRFGEFGMSLHLNSLKRFAQTGHVSLARKPSYVTCQAHGCSTDSLNSISVAGRDTEAVRNDKS